MIKIKYMGAALALVISNVAMASSYNCTVKEYVSEQSAETADIIEPFTVELNGADDTVPAEFRQAGNVAWSVTRYDGLISAEVRDTAGRSISISTTKDGQSLGVKVISAKQILTCNPAGVKSFKVDPKSYGEMLIMNPKTYGSTIYRSTIYLNLKMRSFEQMLRDSKAYGSTEELIESLDPKLREQFKEYLEEREKQMINK